MVDLNAMRDTKHKAARAAARGGGVAHLAARQGTQRECARAHGTAEVDVARHGGVQVAVGARRDGGLADGAGRDMLLLSGGGGAVVSGWEAMALAELAVACVAGVRQVVDVAAGRQSAARSETFDFHEVVGCGWKGNGTGLLGLVDWLVVWFLVMQ